MRVPGDAATPARNAPGRRSHPHRLRRQPPVAPPFRIGHLLGATRDAFVPGDDPRTLLGNLLKVRFLADAVDLYGNGTSALAAAIRIGLGESGRGPVALPAFTCFDIGTSTLANECEILFYDVDPHTLSPDASSLRSALRRGARVVVVSHLFGIPVGWDDVHRLAREHGAFLVEDAAQGNGAYLAGRPLGSLGDASVLSFGRGKGWTGGHGGALLLRGEAARRRRFGRPIPRPHPVDEARLGLELAAQLVLGRPTLYWLPTSLPWLQLGTTVFKPVPPTRDIPRLSAALVLRTRTHSAQAAWRRREMAHLWRRWIPERPAVRHIQPLDRADPSYLRYPLRLASGLGGFARPAAARRLGVAESYSAPLYALTQLRPRILHPAQSCPGAEELARCLVTLPSHDLLSADEVQSMIELLAGYGGETPGPVTVGPERTSRTNGGA